MAKKKLCPISYFRSQNLKYGFLVKTFPKKKMRLLIGYIHKKYRPSIANIWILKAKTKKIRKSPIRPKRPKMASDSLVNEIAWIRFPYCLQNWNGRARFARCTVPISSARKRTNYLYTLRETWVIPQTTPFYKTGHIYEINEIHAIQISKCLAIIFHFLLHPPTYAFWHVSLQLWKDATIVNRWFLPIELEVRTYDRPFARIVAGLRLFGKFLKIAAELRLGG